MTPAERRGSKTVILVLCGESGDYRYCFVTNLQVLNRVIKQILWRIQIIQVCIKYFCLYDLSCEGGEGQQKRQNASLVGRKG